LPCVGYSLPRAAFGIKRVLFCGAFMSSCGLKPCAPACAAIAHAAAHSKTRPTRDIVDVRFIPASGKMK
jgi:hypothetical protein